MKMTRIQAVAAATAKYFSTASRSPHVGTASKRCKACFILPGQIKLGISFRSRDNPHFQKPVKDAAPQPAVFVVCIQSHFFLAMTADQLSFGYTKLRERMELPAGYATIANQSP
jgi:hypothetical protein